MVTFNNLMERMSVFRSISLLVSSLMITACNSQHFEQEGTNKSINTNVQEFGKPSF